jgi:hypothetical protein
MKIKPITNKISPVINWPPKNALPRSQKANKILPRIKISMLILERKIIPRPLRI